MQPNEMEMYLLLKAKYEGKELREASKDIQAMERQTKESSKGMVGSLEDTLKAVGQLRMMFFRIAFVVGLFVGVGKSVSDANKELSDMQKSARELGYSFADMQRYKTGLVWSEQDLKNLKQTTNAFREMGVWIKNVWTGLGVGLGGIFNKIFPRSEVTLLGKDAETVMKTLNAETQKLTLSSIGYQKYQMQMMKDNYRQQLELELNLSSEQRRIREETLNAWYSAQVNTLNRARWGFKSFVEERLEMERNFAQATSTLFADTFIDGLDNKLKNAREIFGSFLIDVRNMFIKGMVNQAMGNFFSAVFPMFSKNVTIPPFQSGNVSVTPFQTGGVVTKPTLAMLGEKESEAVIPLSKLKGEGEVTNIYNNNYINAVDPQSFASLVARNPEAIVAVVSDAIQRNRGIRRTIKELA